MKTQTQELRRAEPVVALVRDDILQKFPGLFGTRKVNGREINIQETIATLSRELDPDIAAALTARRALLQSAAPVREKYAWPKWDERSRIRHRESPGPFAISSKA
jgi:hypothetical protein